MQTSIHKISILFSVMLGLAITSLTACAVGNNKYPARPSKDSGLMITFNPEGGLNVEASDGRKFESCYLPCSEETTDKYNKKCPKVDPENFCKGLIDATTVDVHSITIIDTMVNPYCRTIIIGGRASEICYCKPGERDPRCRN
jgi:hypothetical protein